MRGASAYLKLMWGLWGRGESVSFKITVLLSVPWKEAVEMTSPSLSLSFPLCQVGICDTLRSRQWEIQGNLRTAQILKSLASSFACSKVIIANCLMFACWNRDGKPKVDPVGGHARYLLLFCLLRVMFAGVRGTSSSCAQPRCFQWKIFFFLVTFALIFIRKPVCGLPWSITQLFTPWVKNVYRPRRSVCVSSLMNWAPTSATLGSGMETSPLFRLLSSPISFFPPRLSDF